MGLFHKTIKDIKVLVEAGKFVEASKIAKKHIKDEHHFDSHLVRLQRLVAKYHEDLNAISRSDSPNMDKGVVMQYVDDADHCLEIIKALLLELTREEKILLE